MTSGTPDARTSWEQMVAFLGRIKEHWRSIISVVGGISLTFGTMQTIFKDGLYLWSAYVTGLVLLLIAAIGAGKWTEETKSVVVEASGTPVAGRRRVVPPVVQWVSCAAFGIFLPLGYWLWKLPHSTLNGMFMNAVNVANASFVNVDGKTVYVGSLNDSRIDWEGDGEFLLTNSFDLEIFVQKAYRHPRVVIERLYFEVEDFRPAKPTKQFSGWQVYGLQESHLYYVVIDDPKKAGKNVFEGDRQIERGRDDHFRSKQLKRPTLEENLPERMYVRVTSNTYGLFRLSLKADVTVGAKRQTIDIGTFPVYFDPPVEPE